GPPRVDLYAGRPRQVPLVGVAVVGVAQTSAPYGIWVRRDSSRALLTIVARRWLRDPGDLSRDRLVREDSHRRPSVVVQRAAACSLHVGMDEVLLHAIQQAAEDSVVDQRASGIEVRSQGCSWRGAIRVTDRRVEGGVRVARA